jgi:hypothetical protein
MPLQELPEEFLKPIGSPSNSSLSSNSSDVILINAHYIRNVRSGSESSVTTNDDIYEPSSSVSNNRTHNEQVEEKEATYQPIKLPTEPTLEELLVIFPTLKNKIIMRVFSASSHWRWRFKLDSTDQVANYIISCQPAQTSIFHATIAHLEFRGKHVVFSTRSWLRFE